MTVCVQNSSSAVEMCMIPFKSMADAWPTLNRDTSRPFSKPLSVRIAVKVINHLGDEVMKVFRVQ